MSLLSTKAIAFQNYIQNNFNDKTKNYLKAGLLTAASGLVKMAIVIENIVNYIIGKVNTLIKKESAENLKSKVVVLKDAAVQKMADLFNFAKKAIA